ncbi:inorganic phosphate transporter [Parasphingopyxis marina]|uniref:Phosphate transporter n=1 Tax=Parasphingopyxis marina TaxID=2761622 RepID=A0A842HWN3_9SPHN|nr:inorganic phosphate transporter [Parasphingopyxis marina]MBC2776761.1 inorganic phosphate transporter [Parasphingopyxis marina]
MANSESALPPSAAPFSPFSISGTSLAFGFLLVAMTGYFLFWGLDYTNHNHVLLFVLATIFGVFMAFNIGGNDVANSFGTSVGAGTLTIKQALLIAAIFEVSGAVIAGGEVTDTIRSGIVDLSGVAVEPMQFVYIMMSALLAAALWLLFASKRGWPVSTTHSIIGGIVGSSIALGIMLSGSETAMALVQWDKVGTIAISWILSPVLGGLASYALFHQIKKHILQYNERVKDDLKVIKTERKQLNEEHKTAFERLSEIQQIAYTNTMVRDAQALREEDFTPDDLESDYYKKLNDINLKKESVAAHKALETWVPLIAALGAAIISAMLLFKGLKHMDLGLTTLNNYLIMGMVAAGVWMATYIFARTLKGASLDRSTFLMFSWMQVFTASGFAFSHGSNDIANAIGPFAAILDVLRTGEIGASAAVPPAAMITFGVALIVGLWFIGKEVIATVGHNLTTMHPASGFSAELAAAAVVMGASTFGLPVSSTHILIGAVLGIGLVNNQTNWGLMKPIALAWVITLPAAAALSGLCFVVLFAIF